MLDTFFGLSFGLGESTFEGAIKELVYGTLAPGDSNPVNQAFAQYNKLVSLSDGVLGHGDVTDAVRRLTQSDVRRYRDGFMRDVSVVCSVLGNAQQSHAEQYTQIFISRLRKQGSRLSTSNRRPSPSFEQFDLPAHFLHHPMTSSRPSPLSLVLRSRTASPSNRNSAAVVVYQFGGGRDGWGGRGGRGAGGKPGYFLGAVVEVFGQLMTSVCYEYLRLKVRVTRYCNVLSEIIYLLLGHVLVPVGHVIE